MLIATTDSYDMTTGVRRLTEDIREYIDDRFPWVDGYKPKYDEIDHETSLYIPLSEKNTDIVNLVLDLNFCGWLGICQDEDCNFLDVSPALLETPY